MDLVYLTMFVANFLIWKLGTHFPERLAKKNLLAAISGSLAFVLIIPYFIILGVTEYAQLNNEPLFNAILIFGVAIFLVPAFLKTKFQQRNIS